MNIFLKIQLVVGDFVLKKKLKHIRRTKKVHNFLTAKRIVASIDKIHIEQAIKDMDLIVDVTTDDLQQLFGLTLQHANTPLFDSEQIKLGHYYTNGLHGPDWSVRHIIDESHDKKMVIYRIVEGQGLKSSGSCSRDEFFKWSAWEVYHHI